MVKRGGLKRKIAIAKIEKKSSRGPCYSKRCNGLFGKASQLCLLSGAQIAVLATPLSENSNVSFFSFGHSSVDALVSSYLSGRRPLVPLENKKHMRDDMGICLTQKSIGLGFWWEHETLTESQDAKEVSDAIDSMTKLLRDTKKLGSVNNQLHLGDHDNMEVKKTEEPEPSLNFQPCIPDDCLNKTTEVLVLDACDVSKDKTEEYDQNNFEEFNNVLAMDFDQVYQLIDFGSSLLDDSVFDKTHQELPEDHIVSNHGTHELDCQALPAENLDIRDIDQLIDSESFLSYDGILETSFQSLLSSDCAVESNRELHEFADNFLSEYVL